ncbi:4'-phosphopantetheinyl transferase family protein [Pseudomonas shirazensis]
MIGNDVIDIVQSRKESNWRRKGFIEKIFTPDEQLLIANAIDQEIMVWMLWSMKESAYKVYNRQTKIREFSPEKLVCSITSQNDNSYTGNVVCSGNTYYTHTILSPENIHTIAVSNLLDLTKVEEIENKAISKDKNGIPFWTNAQNTIQDVSKSHHGKFEKVITISISPI